MVFFTKRIFRLSILALILLTLFLGINKLRQRTALAITPTPCKICDPIYLTCVNSEDPSCSSAENQCSQNSDCSILPDGSNCNSNSDCSSGLCGYLPIHDGKVCVSNGSCTPGTIIPNDPNVSLSCTLKCSSTGYSWITQWDLCTSYSENPIQYCDGNILKTKDVTIVDGKPVVSETSVLCPGGCIRGLCVAQVGLSCVPGENSYVQGSCSGISGCPFTFPDKSYDGNCLARCNSSGQWHVTSACGNISVDTTFTDTQRFEILKTLSYFSSSVLAGAGIDFTKVDSLYITPNFLSTLFGNLISNYTSEDINASCGATQASPFVSANIQIAGCGLKLQEWAYAHEAVHYIVSQNPDLYTSYKIAVGCGGSLIGSERYQFSKEKPVSSYGSTNCGEAMGDAAAAYQTKSCKMKAESPIQYAWMKDNLYEGKEFCNQSSLIPPNPYSPQVAGVSTSPGTLLNLSIPQGRVLATSLPKPYSGQFAIGSTQSQVTSELGAPASTSSDSGLTILTYNASDSEKPNVFAFNFESKLVYFRVDKGKILSNYQIVDSWTADFKNPEAISPSITDYGATRLIYPRQGFSTVTLNETGEVTQYEAFVPIYLDEYLDTWGDGIARDKLGYPSNHKKGDINRDLTVNNDDYTLLAPEFGKTGFSEADIDWDRVVDGVDYVIWLNNTVK